MKINILTSAGTIFMIFFLVSTFLQNKLKDETILLEPEKVVMQELYLNSEIGTIASDFKSNYIVKKDGYDYRTYYISFEEDYFLDNKFTQ